MKKRIATALAILLIMCSIFVLTACTEEPRMPLRQGSVIFEIKGQPIDGSDVVVFEDYETFKKSEYANMKLGSCNVVAHKSYYTKEFFAEHSLIIAKINVPIGSHSIIKSITKKHDGTRDIFEVELVNIVNCMDRAKKLAICNIELDKTPITGADVIVNQHEELILEGFPTLDKYSKALDFYCSSIRNSGEPLAVTRYNTLAELNAYTTNANDVSKKVCALFDDKFFEDNYILAVDYLENSVDTAVAMALDNGVITINTYSNHHYVYVDAKERIVKLVPLPKTTVVTRVNVNNYNMSDVGESNEPTITVINTK